MFSKSWAGKAREKPAAARSPQTPRETIARKTTAGAKDARAASLLILPVSNLFRLKPAAGLCPDVVVGAVYRSTTPKQETLIQPADSAHGRGNWNV
jgi:hypothetical protein